jgi:hypothetical protein
LDGESLRQGHRKALEIVVLNELVQIDTQHFESNTHMTSKSKVFLNSDNIFAVIVVCISKCLQYFDLNFTLFMKFFPILQDLDGHMLLFFVIKASEYYTKSTPTQFLLNLISILKLILGFVEEVGLIIIKTMIEWAILVFGFWVFILTSQFILDILTYSFILTIEVNVIDCLIVDNLVSFIR